MKTRVYALFLALPILGATPSPSPSTTPTAPPGWTAAAVAPGQVLRFTRTDSDGSASEIALLRQVCECQPQAMIDLIGNAVKPLGATVIRDSAQVCGTTGLRITATGIANVGGRKNLMVIFFRSGDALIGQEYSFTRAQPAQDAVTALEAMCPT